MPPAERISRHIARILRVTATGKALAGTGYVAPFGHLATCAHVVAFALTGSNETGPEPPQGELLFELLGESPCSNFYLLSTACRRLLLWHATFPEDDAAATICMGKMTGRPS